jgi:hypothetical protein
LVPVFVAIATRCLLGWQVVLQSLRHLPLLVSQLAEELLEAVVGRRLVVQEDEQEQGQEEEQGAEVWLDHRLHHSECQLSHQHLLVRPTPLQLPPPQMHRR